MNCPNCAKFYNGVACELCGYTEGESILSDEAGVEPVPGVPEIDSGEGEEPGQPLEPEPPMSFEEAVEIVLGNQAERLDIIETEIRQMGGKIIATGQNLGRLQVQKAQPEPPKSFMQELADAPDWVKELAGTVVNGVNKFINPEPAPSPELTNPEMIMAAQLLKEVYSKQVEFIRGRVMGVMDDIYSDKELMVKDE